MKLRDAHVAFASTHSLPVQVQFESAQVVEFMMLPQDMFPSKQVCVELSHVQLVSIMQFVKFREPHVELSTQWLLVQVQFASTQVAGERMLGQVVLASKQLLL